MRRFILLSSIIIFTSLISFAQDTSFLRNYNATRIHTTKTAMLVLGGWGAANLAVGLIGNSQTTGTTKYFHQMNAIWGAVNLGIATAGYFGRRRLNEDWQGSIKEQHKIEKIYLINGALDVAYIGAGVYAYEHGKNKLNDRWKGYGVSLLTQGAFLLLYDGINYAIHRKHGKQLVNP